MSTLEVIESKLQALENKLLYHIEDELLRDNTMEHQMKSLDNKVDLLSAQVETLITMWQQARGVLTFTRWLLWVTGSVVAILAFFKGARG